MISNDFHNVPFIPLNVPGLEDLPEMLDRSTFQIPSGGVSIRLLPDRSLFPDLKSFTEYFILNMKPALDSIRRSLSKFNVAVESYKFRYPVAEYYGVKRYTARQYRSYCRMLDRERRKARQ